MNGQLELKLLGFIVLMSEYRAHMVCMRDERCWQI